MRALLAILLFAVAACCAFGFAATFEPLEPGTQLRWRLAYAAGGSLAIAGLIRLWILARSSRRPGG